MPPPGLDALKHVVVLMMENRSFDLSIAKTASGRANAVDVRQARPALIEQLRRIEPVPDSRLETTKSPRFVQRREGCELRFLASLSRICPTRLGGLVGRVVRRWLAFARGDFFRSKVRDGVSEQLLSLVEVAQAGIPAAPLTFCTFPREWSSRGRTPP